jgi:hypothetical protein
MEVGIMRIEPVNKLSVKKNNRGNAYYPDERRQDRLDCFLHEPRSQATGTDFNSLGCAFYESANCAEIWAKDPFRPIIGVADIITN